ncbi:hypothetical protein [Haliangium sp.]|uniref:hypothetical protein n=1 Tax=Haliangium sp. TaxID=2663208 RepID=UPI003D151925
MAWAGCWFSGRGDIGLTLGPAVYETFAINGVVRAAPPCQAPLTDARIEVVDADAFAPAYSGLDGYFSLDFEQGHPRSHFVDSTSVLLTSYESRGDLVTHVHPAYQGHQHREVTLRVQKLGYRPTEVRVEIPRDTREPPLDIRLLPVEVPDSGLAPCHANH